MTKEVYIRLRDGEKESEYKVSEANEVHQLALMDGLFKFFDLGVDFKEIAEIYQRSGKAYQQFFAELDNEETLEKLPPLPVKNVDPEEYATAITEIHTASDLKEPVVESAEVPKEEQEKPEQKFSVDHTNNDHYITGFKLDSYNRPIYRCRYKCPQCNDESNHYIRPGTQYIRCWKCQRMLKVTPATAFGEPETGKNPDTYRDVNGNFYVAGAFEVNEKTLADAEKEE